MKHAWLYGVVLCWGCNHTTPVAPVVPTTTSATLAPAPAAPVVPESNDPPRDAERVVTRLRPRFRNCYERALVEEDRGMSGVIVLHLRVAPNGSVQAVDVAKRNGLSSGVAGCISRQAQGAVFDAPGAGGAALDIPVHFVRTGAVTRLNAR